MTTIDGREVQIVEKDMPGMVGETCVALAIEFENGDDTIYLNNDTLKMFKQDDREALVEYMDYVRDLNHNSAVSWVI